MAWYLILNFGLLCTRRPPRSRSTHPQQHHLGSSVFTVCFSPDGRMVASGSGDRTVRLWDVETGACVRTLEGHGDTVGSLCFSPNGRQLASGSDDRTVRLWLVV